MTYCDDKGEFVLRWSRRLPNGKRLHAKGKPFKIYINKK